MLAAQVDGFEGGGEAESTDETVMTVSEGTTAVNKDRLEDEEAAEEAAVVGGALSAWRVVTAFSSSALDGIGETESGDVS